MTVPTTRMDPTEVGAALRAARTDRGLDFRRAAAASGLSPATIRVLENTEPAEWAGDATMLAALRLYARHVDLDPEPLVKSVWSTTGRHSYGSASVPPLVPGAAYRHTPRRRRRWLLATAVIVVLAVLGAGLYASGLIPGVESTADEASDTEAQPEPQQAGPEPQTSDSDESAAEADAGTSATDDEPADSGESAQDTESEDVGQPEDELDGLPPEQTPVQVLNALDDADATAEAVEVLEGLGYDIVLVDETIQLWPTSAVYHNDGWSSEAESLNARDDRFAVGGENPVFVDDAGLHVVVGLDWNE